MAGVPETSGLLRGQQCSSRGCPQEESGGFRGCVLPSTAKATKANSPPIDFSARVQVGGETEGKELKAVPPHPAQRKAQAQTQRCGTASSLPSP